MVLTFIHWYIYINLYSVIYSDKPNISIFTIPKYRSYEPSQMFHVAVTRTVEKKRQRQCFNIVPRELNTFLL